MKRSDPFLDIRVFDLPLGDLEEQVNFVEGTSLQAETPKTFFIGRADSGVGASYPSFPRTAQLGEGGQLRYAFVEDHPALVYFAKS